MEGVSIIIPVCNKIETTLSCVRSIREHNEGEPYEIIIVDNGSTDATRATFDQDRDEDITYIRNEENLGIARACNLGAGTARYDTLCFMHNDVFIHSDNWTGKIRAFIAGHADAGVVGLYGAKVIRDDGSFRGKSIVHAMHDRPAMHRVHEKVAVVDGLLMAMSSRVFQGTGGFHGGFPMHFYDKDISMRAGAVNCTNYVLNIPFEHRCGTTRKEISGENRERESARRKFADQWKDRLPADVTTWRERVSYLFSGRR